MRRHSIAVMGWTLWDGRGRTPTGGAVATYELTRRLSKYFECDMIFETSDPGKAGKTEDIDDGFGKRFVIRPKGFWRLDEDFLCDYDLIHVWDAAPVFTYRAFTREFLPHCQTLHSAASMTDWIRIASAFYVREHDMIALGSRCLAEALNRLWNVPVEVIPYGVDTDVFKPMDRSECRESLGLPEDQFILGYLGRLSKFDFHLAYDTVTKVKKLAGKGDIMLVVAGGNKDVKPVYVKDDFVYLGFLEKAEVPQFLNSCDFFFNPVAGVHEGFGLTVVEAMSCGLPIVTTSWNGYRETVSPDVGFLARTCWKNGDVWINQPDLSSSCLELIKNEGLRETMGERARLRVEQNYRWDICVERYRTRLLDLIHKDKPECVPYEEAPTKIALETDGKPRVCSLEEAFRNPENIRVDFLTLHKGFVSGFQTEGKGWRKFTCTDNIVNLPKYRTNMKGTLNDLEQRLTAHFPRFRVMGK